MGAVVLKKRLRRRSLPLAGVGLLLLAGCAAQPKETVDQVWGLGGNKLAQPPAMPAPPEAGPVVPAPVIATESMAVSPVEQIPAPPEPSPLDRALARAADARRSG